MRLTDQRLLLLSRFTYSAGYCFEMLFFTSYAKIHVENRGGLVVPPMSSRVEDRWFKPQRAPLSLS